MTWKAGVAGGRKHDELGLREFNPYSVSNHDLLEASLEASGKTWVAF